LRQNAIDDELFDVISGFETLSKTVQSNQQKQCLDCAMK
jgi:hypothetical protein